MSKIEKRCIPVNSVMIETVIKDMGDSMVCTTHPFGGWNDADPPAEKWLEHFVWVSQRGRGSSSPYQNRQDLSFAQLVDDIEAVRQALGIRRWAFFGFSSGGAIGLMYALKYPQSITGLITMGTVANYPELYQDPRCSFSPNHPGYVASTEETRYIDQVFWEEAFKVDVLDQLGSIRAPALIMGGRKDPIVPVDYLELLHQGIPGSELAIFENSEHGASEADFPEYQATIQKFLEQIK